MRVFRSAMLLPTVIGAALVLSNSAGAQATTAEGPWMIRLRAASLTPANKSDAIPSLNVAADKITVSDKIIPDLDISYFFTKHIAAELVLTYPQQHDVELNGNKIGTFKHLPPTLLAQYHFLPEGVIRPYVGVGVNLTLISDVDIAVSGVGKLDLESSSVGAAGQVGVDIRLAPGKYLNLDVKKVMIGSDVTLGSTKVSAVKVDPILASVGFGIRF
ncbi:MAG: outer membrane beta-barrel protein [Gemmatimonadetes bacterium]|nr:outer membrane beta-barrel protein [Gemmatimonadota bacterium]